MTAIITADQMVVGLANRIASGTNANSPGDNNTLKVAMTNQGFFTTTPSDARYKKNVAKLSNALAIVDRLEPVSFEWKPHPVHNFPAGKTLGFIAQDLKTALSDTGFVDNIVSTSGCTHKNGAFEEYLGITETKLIALLTSAVKELHSEVTTLKARIALLEK